MLGEVLVVAMLVLRLLPFIYFPACRRSSHWLVQRGAWAACHLSFLLAPLCAVVSLAIRFSLKLPRYGLEFLPVMLVPDAAVLPGRMSYHVRVGAPYTWLDYFDCLHYFLLLWAGSSIFFPIDSPLITKLYALFIFFGISVQEGRESKGRAQSTEQSELVAHHMSAEGMNPHHPYFAATSDGSDVVMAERCKYLVNPLDDHSELRQAVIPPSYRLRAHGADAHQRWITVRDVWRSELGVLCCERQASIRDSCLSLAFARLLTRRYYGLPCAEANDPRARDFVLKELMSEEDEYRRAFRVVEVELNFLHDYFHISEYYYGIDHAYKTSASRLAFLLLFLPCIHITTAAFAASRRPPTVTLLVALVILAIPELLWLMSHSASHWSEASYALHYINGHFWKASIIKWCIDHLERFSLYKHQHWQNKMGQFSVLEDFERYPGRPPRRSMISLHDDVKRAVGRALVQSEGRLTNGVSSLERNGVLEMFSWACTQQAPTHEIVLIWHIATSYCEIFEQHSCGTDGESDQVQRCHLDVARNLSRYCAYLVAFAPKFLPGDCSETSQTTAKLKEAIKEAKQLLGRNQGKLFCFTIYFGWWRKRRNTSRQDKYDKLRSLDVSPGSVLQKGVKLGRMLSEEVQSSRRRWEVLADLWAEVLLHVAPSDDAKHHMSHLARGGEFVTHLWALLSNAGLLKRDQPDGDRAEAR